VLTAGLLLAAGSSLDYINSQRKEMKLVINEPLENAPPSLAFATVAMGAFRGLVVDVLWIRAEKLKREGQFFDAKQLAEWITILQPRFSGVWEFQAWNMAYNISVAMPATEPEQRWMWVKNGWELLRDKGIPLNPKSILLYRELARIFQDKIGSVRDDVHKYYKLQLVEAMTPLVGPATHEYFDQLVEAPLSWDQIISDASVVPMISELKAADELFEDEENFVNNYLALRQNPARYKPDAFRAIDRYRGTDALEKFDIFAKAFHLRNTWKLDLELVEELNHTYGPIDWNDPNKHIPLDWRHPDSHAIYWAVKGLRIAAKEKYSTDELNTDRIVAHSMQNLFRGGKIFIYNSPRSPDAKSAKKSEIFIRPDLRMFISYNNTVLKVMEKYKKRFRHMYESLQFGHRNMLKNAVFSFYQAGHINQARKIYNDLRKLYPREEFNVPLAIYVKNKLREELEILDVIDVREMLQMLLRESYFRYALRDDDEAFGREKMAKEIYDSYNKANPDEKNRINLPDIKLLKYLALLDFFNDDQYPRDLRMALLGRIQIERPKLAEQLKKQEEFLQRLSEQQKSEQQ
jgi:hypothetical protein